MAWINSPWLRPDLWVLVKSTWHNLPFPIDVWENWNHSWSVLAEFVWLFKPFPQFLRLSVDIVPPFTRFHINRIPLLWFATFSQKTFIAWTSYSSNIRLVFYQLVRAKCVRQKMQLRWPLLPTPGEAKAKAMPGRLYIHTKIINNNNK